MVNSLTDITPAELIASVVGVATTLFLDYRQTLTIAKNPGKFHEDWNPILKEHPTVQDVHQYFAGIAVAVSVLLATIHEYRPELFVPLAIMMTIFEGVCVINNYLNGIKP